MPCVKYVPIIHVLLYDIHTSLSFPLDLIINNYMYAHKPESFEHDCIIDDSSVHLFTYCSKVQVQ